MRSKVVISTNFHKEAIMPKNVQPDEETIAINQLVDKFMEILIRGGWKLDSPQVAEFFKQHRRRGDFVSRVQTALTNFLIGPGC